MKKLIALLLAATLSIGCFAACGKKAEEKPAAEVTTEETTTEAATDDANAAFIAFLDAIYSAQPGTAGGEEKTAEAAETFKEYVFANGEATSAEAVTLATSAYLTERSAENPAFVENFADAFAAVCDACVEEDETIETDVSYLNFVNGIDDAIEAFIDAEEPIAEEGELTAEFAAFLDGIYAAQPGTAGGEEKTAAAAEAFKEYVFANGEGTTPNAITYATSLYLKEKVAEDEYFMDNFEESFAAVCDACFDADETLEGDTSFLKFVDGIDAAIEEMYEE